MGADPLGVARIGRGGGQGRPGLVLDGPCVTDTIRDLEQGRRGTPMARAALEEHVIKVAKRRGIPVRHE